MSAKKVMITGATSGIGLALFNAMSESQYDVIATGRNLEKLKALSPKPNKALCFDITNKSEVLNLKNTISKLDILVINAGTCQYIDDAIQFNSQSFEEVITTNLISVGWLLEALLSKISKGGQIVFISSSATLLPFPRSEAYGASKAGLDYLANSLRIDLADKNIDITLVHPGFVKTPLTDKNDFAMPFIMSSDSAAQRIKKAIEKRSKYCHFPKRLTFLLKFFSFLPTRVWQSFINQKG